jgi:spermidine synthase
MGVEMAGARLLAPFFGTSLYVWAVLIGLIMVYLTAGYYLGGRLADRFPMLDALCLLTLLAGLTVGLIPLVSEPILRWSAVGFDELSAGVFLGSLAAVLLLFALPVIALGCVSPWAVRLAVSSVQEAGHAAGSIYALSTCGSLAGTFITVFLAIPTIGTRRTILCLGMVLIAASLPAAYRRWPVTLLAPAPLVLLLLLPPGAVRAAQGGTLIYEGESAYYYIQVVQSGSTRELVLDEGHAVHSVYDPTRLLSGEYWDYFLAAPLFSPGYSSGRIRHIAVLGLGGGTAVRLFAAAYPQARIDGVEIDPAILSVARRYFDMREPQLTTYAEDARYFLLTHRRRYDVVAVDAFRQPYIPFQLTTTDFFRLVRSHLTRSGVVAINAGHTATDYRLVNAIARTMATVFPSVAIMDVPGTINSVIVASNRPSSPRILRHNAARSRGITRTVAMRALRQGNLRLPRRGGTIFTDDLAPVEQLIDQIVLDYVRAGGA